MRYAIRKPIIPDWVYDTWDYRPMRWYMATLALFGISLLFIIPSLMTTLVVLVGSLTAYLVKFNYDQYSRDYKQVVTSVSFEDDVYTFTTKQGPGRIYKAHTFGFACSHVHIRVGQELRFRANMEPTQWCVSRVFAG